MDGLLQSEVAPEAQYTQHRSPIDQGVTKHLSEWSTKTPLTTPCIPSVVHTTACRERRVTGNYPGGTLLHDLQGSDGVSDVNGDWDRDLNDSDDSDSDGSGSGSGEEGQENERSEGGDGTKKRRQGAERQGRQRQQQRGEQRRQLDRTRAMREHREKVASGGYSEVLSHTVSAVMAVSQACVMTTADDGRGFWLCK